MFPELFKTTVIVKINNASMPFCISPSVSPKTPWGLNTIPYTHSVQEGTTKTKKTKLSNGWGPGQNFKTKTVYVFPELSKRRT